MPSRLTVQAYSEIVYMVSFDINVWLLIKDTKYKK